MAQAQIQAGVGERHVSAHENDRLCAGNERLLQPLTPNTREIGVDVYNAPMNSDRPLIRSSSDSQSDQVKCMTRSVRMSALVLVGHAWLVAASAGCMRRVDVLPCCAWDPPAGTSGMVMTC